MGILESIDQIFLIIGKFIMDWLGSFMPEWAVELINNIVVTVILLLVGVFTVIAFSWMERKVIARVQDRIGPNRAGPAGIFQAFADAIKMLTKEIVIPDRADKVIYFAGPIVIVTAAVLAYAVVPFGRGMIGQDLNIGVLYITAVASLTTIAMMCFGWGSNNKYALLGGLRNAAQLMSFEIPMILSIIAVVLLAGSMSTVKIVESQSNLPYMVLLPGAFLVYFVSAIAEANRTPFDFPEAESELVAGVHIEYSGMAFAMYFIAEYVNFFAIAAMITTLWLGGWQGPVLPSWLWFLGKTLVVIFVLMWIRDSLPRFRIDHLLSFAWKFLLPLALVNLFTAALVTKLVDTFWVQSGVMLAINLVVTVGALFAGGWAIRRSQQRQIDERMAQRQARLERTSNRTANV